MNIIAKHRTLRTSVYQSVLLSVPSQELWPTDTVVVGVVLLNTAGPGLFSTSLISGL